MAHFSDVINNRSAVRGQPMVFDGSTLTTVFGPKWRLLLIGAGQLSQAVAQMALMLDFEVLVCDPREEYAATLVAGLPGVRRIEGMPDDVVRELVPDVHTAIVALTHDPKLDDMALLEALQSGAFYVGALGSRRNQATRKQRLAEHFGPARRATGAAARPGRAGAGSQNTGRDCSQHRGRDGAGQERPGHQRHGDARVVAVTLPTILVLASGRGARFAADPK